MNVLELIDDVIHALNQLPNARLSGRFNDTYALVVALEQAQRQNSIRLEIRGGVLQEPIAVGFPQGVRVELVDYDSDERSAVSVFAEDNPLK